MLQMQHLTDGKMKRKNLCRKTLTISSTPWCVLGAPPQARLKMVQCFTAHNRVRRHK